MHIFFLIMSLVTMTLLQAADDSIEQSMSHLSLDAQGSKDYKLRLENVVQAYQVSQKYSGKIHTGVSFNETKAFGLSAIMECMKKYKIEDYAHIFNALADAQLPDLNKLAYHFVEIPFFQELKAKSLQEQQCVLKDFSHERHVLNYPFLRLFFAVFSHIGIGDDGYMLCTALHYKDTHLVRQLLKQGANPNGCKDLLPKMQKKSRDMWHHPLQREPMIDEVNTSYSTLWWCKTKQDAKLLLDFGANIVQQHSNNDIIEPICTSLKKDYDDEGVQLMRFYFASGVPLHEENRFGYGWFRILLKSLDAFGKSSGAVKQKLSVLWELGDYKNKKIEEYVAGYTTHPAIHALMNQDENIANSHPNKIRTTKSAALLKIPSISMKKRVADKCSLEYFKAPAD